MLQGLVVNVDGGLRASRFLPLVSMEWKNGSNSGYNCTPFLHSLLTKGKDFNCALDSQL